MIQTSAVPKQLYAVSLASDDIAGQRRFYEGWGWQALPYSNDDYVAFQLGGAIVAFVRRALLADEAAPGADAPAALAWNGVTLAVNLPARDQVDSVWRTAVAAGARAVGEPVDRPWGGRSGYVADPEGNRWEIAWVPPM